MQENELRAMVLAAGVGSRLEPLSSAVPKPLIRIGGRPVMEHILLLLKKHGFKNVISNTHHLAEQIHEYFKDSEERLGVKTEFRYEKELSGVAGGIRHCKDFLKQGTACIIMGDALTDIDLAALYQKHKEAVEKKGCLVTIAMMEVEDTSQFGVIVTDEEARVTQFQEKPKAEEALSSWANTGVYIFEPEVYDYIPSEEEAPFYDVAKNLFPRLLENDKYMQAIPVKKETYWADLGNPKQYLQSMNDVSEGKIKLDFEPLLSPEAKIDGSAKLNAVNEIASNVTIHKNVVLRNCIVWEDAEIQEAAELEDCIIGPKARVEAGLKINNQILIADPKLCKLS